VGGQVALAAGVAAGALQDVADEGDGQQLVQRQEAVEDLLGRRLEQAGVDGGGSDGHIDRGGAQAAEQALDGVGSAGRGWQDHGAGPPKAGVGFVTLT